MIFLALVAADCEWKEKDITVQEGEAVRFTIIFDIITFVTTVFDVIIIVIIIIMIIIIIRFLKKFKKVKLCLGGKLTYKPIKDVEFTLACNGI